jgi:hypothetical protein
MFREFRFIKKIYQPAFSIFKYVLNLSRKQYQDSTLFKKLKLI